MENTVVENTVKKENEETVSLDSWSEKSPRISGNEKKKRKLKL